MTEALQPLQRAFRTQRQGNAPRTAASTPPQSRPATPQLSPPPRGAWQNQQQRNGQGFRGGNANQSGGTSRGFFQPQGRNNGNNRPHTPRNLQRNKRQFQQRPTTPPTPARPRRGPDVMCAVTDVVTRRFIDEMAPYRLISVAYRLLGTVSVTVEPPQA